MHLAVSIPRSSTTTHHSFLNIQLAQCSPTSADNRTENVTLKLEWCWLKVEAPADVSAGSNLAVELRRSGALNTVTEGVLSTSVGEFSFSIEPGTRDRSVPLHIPEAMAGHRFSIQLRAVRGCLLYGACSGSGRTLSVRVLPSKDEVHFEREEVTVQRPAGSFDKVSSAAPST